MNLDKIRQDFPILNSGIIYFDNACMSLRPKSVVEAMEHYYYEFPACADRSAHQLALKTREEYEKSRAKIAGFIKAKKDEIVFTKNTTEAINLVSQSRGFEKDDVVITTDKEHNSNLLPWQGRKFRHLVFRTDEEFDLNKFEDMMSSYNVRLVSMVHCSNLDSSLIPAKEIAKIAHDHNALFMLDAAQSVPHMEVSVKKIGADFLAFSGHKMLGPSIGVLYGRKSVLEEMQPFIRGGGTVSDSTYEDSKYMPPPEKFEAGLQDYAGAIGLAEAVNYLKKIGVKNIASHEKEMTKLIDEALRRIDGVDIIGPLAEKRCGITSFTVKNVGMHQVAIMLDKMANIAVRSGQHCVHSWFAAHKLEGTVRASLYLYNTEEEVEAFVSTMKKIASLG